jgi:hypothetical protein
MFSKACQDLRDHLEVEETRDFKVFLVCLVLM